MKTIRDMPWYEVAMLLDGAEKRAKSAFKAYIYAARYGSHAEYLTALQAWQGTHARVAELTEELASRRRHERS